MVQMEDRRCMLLSRSTVSERVTSEAFVDWASEG